MSQTNQLTWLQSFYWDRMIHLILWKNISDRNAIKYLEASWALLERSAGHKIGAVAIADRRHSDCILRLHVLVVGAREIPMKQFEDTWLKQPFTMRPVFRVPDLFWMDSILQDENTNILAQHNLKLFKRNM